MVHVISALGESDCEAIGRGWLAQPTNAISSLTFTVVGVALIGYAMRAEGVERLVRWAFVLATVATGIGSFLFHGPQGDYSHFLHDVTFLAVLVVIGVGNLGSALGWTGRTLVIALSVILVGYGGFLLVFPGATNVLTGSSVVLVIGADVAIRRQGAPAARWYAGAVIAMALAIGFFVLGRTGGPICDSKSLFQGHALWHVLSAIGVAAYFVATAGPREAGYSR